MQRHQNPIVAQAFSLIEEVIVANDKLSQTFNVSGEAPPMFSFNIMHGHFLRQYELMDYYHHLWAGNIPAQAWIREGEVEEDGQREQSNAMRVIMAQTSTFVFCLSALEFSFCKAQELDGFVLDSKKDHLLGFMQEACSKKFISEVDLEMWKDLNHIRNSIVHNNGVVRRDVDFYVDGVSRLSVKKGMAFACTYNTFLYLMHWMIKSSYDLISRILKESPDFIAAVNNIKEFRYGC